MNVIKLLQEGDYRSSIGTSFSVDIPFYEHVIEAQLRGRGCHNNLLLVDAGMYSGALPTQAGLFSGAGRRYAVQPVAVGGAFHPKILIQAGERKGRAIFGSANLTFRGLCHNQEVVTELRCTHEDSPELRLLASLFDWVSQWCDPRARATEIFMHALDVGAPWLRTAPRSVGLEHMPDGRHIQWIFSPADRTVPERFSKLLDGDSIKRLVVLAPFWDHELRALADLASLIHPIQGVVVVQTATVRFPVAARNHVPFEITEFRQSPERYLHAKLVIAEGHNWDHVLSGSGNVSVAAFGTSGRSAANCEAMLYQRMPPGTAVATLNLESTISAPPVTDLSNIAPLPPPKVPRENTPRHPGLFEATGRELRWLPDPEVPAAGASVILLDQNSKPLQELYECIERDAVHIFLSATAIPSDASLATVVLSDGRKSAVALVHRIDELRRAVPGPRSAPFIDAIEKFRIGDSDLLSLLKPFQRLLFQEPKESRGKVTGTTVRQNSDKAPPELDQVLPYEDFLKGRVVRSNGHSGTIAAPDADMYLLVKLLFDSFGGMRSSEDQSLLEDQSTELENEIEDPPEVSKRPPIQSRTPKVLTSIAVVRFREQILSLIKSFERWTNGIRECRDARIGADEIPRYWALVSILGYLGSYPVDIEDDKKMDVIPLVPGDIIDFVGVMTRVLGGFFCYHGPDGYPPLACRIDVPSATPDVPDDYFSTWMTCAWAICNAMEVLTLPAASGLPPTDAQDLETIAWWIYTKTGISSAAFDPDACIERLRSIHEGSSLKSQIPTRNLLDRHQWLLNYVNSVQPPAGWIPNPKDRDVNNRFQVGDLVVTKTFGPRYVREVTAKAVSLNNPGRSMQEDDRNECIRVIPGMIAKAQR